MYPISWLTGVVIIIWILEFSNYKHKIKNWRFEDADDAFLSAGEKNYNSWLFRYLHIKQIISLCIDKDVWLLKIFMSYS